jgi:hypothetical protein
MTVFRKKLLILIFALHCYACHQKNTGTRVNVSAKRLDGSPVALAKVTVDGSTVGETNAFGTFTDLVYLSPESEHYVNVSFDDSTYYYSPHTTKFEVQPGVINEIGVQATMYLAPKPKKSAGKSGQEGSTTPDVKGPAHAKSSDLPNDERFSLPLLPITTADFALNAPHATNTSHQPTVMLTAHAFSGHTPLAGATVLWSEPNSYEYQCTTNDRGRCVIQALANSRAPGTLLVRKSGLESISQSLIAAENQNVRLKLNAGTSLDLRFFSAHLKNDKPYDAVKIYDGPAQIATTDTNGYAIIPLSAKRQIDLKFASPRQTMTIAAGEFTEFDEVLKIKLAAHKTETVDYKISDVHVFKNNDIQLGAHVLDAVVDTLIKETAGSRLRSIELSSKSPDSNYIGIIPILEGSTKGLTLTLTVFEPSEGLVISEQISQIPHSESALEAAVATLTDRIKARHSASGFIERIDGNQIHVSMVTDAVKIGDVLNISQRDADLKAIVLNTQRGKAVARISTVIPSRDTWRLLGQKTTRPPRDASNISSLGDLLGKLNPKTPEFEKIALAKKHRMENNPKQALKDLDISNVTDHQTRIILLQERADAHLALDEKGLALASLYEALSHALECAPQSVVNTISININRIRSEILPVLNDDKNLLATLKELDTDNSRLMDQLNAQKADGVVEATLRYATLLTKQKLAETSLDVAGMTTLEQAWDKFFKDLETMQSKERASEIKKAAAFSRKPFLIKPDGRSVRL